MERIDLSMLVAMLSGLATTYGNCTVLAVGTSSENDWTVKVKLPDATEKVLRIPMYHDDLINALNNGLLKQ